MGCRAGGSWLTGLARVMGETMLVGFFFSGGGFDGRFAIRRGDQWMSRRIRGGELYFAGSVEWVAGFLGLRVVDEEEALGWPGGEIETGLPAS